MQSDASIRYREEPFASEKKRRQAAPDLRYDLSHRAVEYLSLLVPLQKIAGATDCYCDGHCGLVAAPLGAQTMLSIFDGATTRSIGMTRVLPARQTLSKQKCVFRSIGLTVPM